MKPRERFYSESSPVEPVVCRGLARRPKMLGILPEVPVNKIICRESLEKRTMPELLCYNTVIVVSERI